LIWDLKEQIIDWNKKKRVNLMSVQQVGPLPDFMIPFSLLEEI
jgi:hypothetical protein